MDLITQPRGIRAEMAQIEAKGHFHIENSGENAVPRSECDRK